MKKSAPANLEGEVPGDRVGTLREERKDPLLEHRPALVSEAVSRTTLRSGGI